MIPTEMRCADERPAFTERLHLDTRHEEMERISRAFGHFERELKFCGELAATLRARELTLGCGQAKRT